MSGWSRDPDDPGPSGDDGRYAPRGHGRARRDPHFVRMTTKVLAMLRGLKGAERRVADAFIAACNARERKEPIIVSHAKIAKGSAVSVRTVIRAIAKMEASGALAACHLRGKGKRNRYWPVFAWGQPPTGWDAKQAPSRGPGKPQNVPNKAGGVARYNVPPESHFEAHNVPAESHLSASASTTRVDEGLRGGEERELRESPSNVRSLATSKGHAATPQADIAAMATAAETAAEDDARRWPSTVLRLRRRT